MKKSKIDNSTLERFIVKKPPKKPIWFIAQVLDQLGRKRKINFWKFSSQEATKYVNSEIFKHCYWCVEDNKKNGE